jgi:predicted tellurium resistance membrane protein TerC
LVAQKSTLLSLNCIDPKINRYARINIKELTEMDWLSDPQAWIALLTLTALEIVLGIDNIIFISILAGKLPEDQQKSGRQIGLLMAMITRILLLFSLAWLTRLTSPLFHVFSHEVSGRDLILIVGGLFLLGKSTLEIHDKLEGEEGHASARVKASFWAVIVQIMLLDIVFSLDSVITAVGMANQLAVMVTAVVIAVLVMLYASGPISAFVNDRPTLKILALSFLLLIGFSLVVEGIHVEIPKGYIYFAMGFSVFVEVLNLRMRAKTEPVRLRQPYVEEEGKTA